MIDHCETCGKPLNVDNPVVSGGGGVDANGEWYSWEVGKCCKPPLTEEQMRKLMAAIFNAT